MHVHTCLKLAIFTVATPFTYTIINFYPVHIFSTLKVCAYEELDTVFTYVAML